MPKVQIFSHQSQSYLTEKVNNFIAEHQLYPEYIHDIKLSVGPTNIVVMIVYEEPEKENFDEDEWDQ